MPKELPRFQKGEPASARKLNAIVDELRRLQQIKGGEGIKVIHTRNGIVVHRQRRVLTTDDRYKLDVRRLNSSDVVRRFCDLKEGDIADVWRVRATIENDPNPDVDDALYRLMWLINRSFGGGGAGGEGGWLTDSARSGLSKEEYYVEHEVATPIQRIGQIGDVIILTDDDLIATTVDGDKFVYANIRHDAHFHLSPGYDGRIYFTTTPPGDEPNGFPIKGEMINDPALANVNTELPKESGQWRPQLKLPTYDIVGEVYQHPNAVSYSFPPQVYVPNTNLRADDFGYIGKDEAWSANYQIPYKIPEQYFGYLIKYCATNTDIVTRYAYFLNTWKAVNNGSSLNIGVGLTSSPFLIPVPAGSTEDTLRYLEFLFIPPASLQDFTLIQVPTFARLAGNILDDLNSRMLIIEVKPIVREPIIPP